MDIPTVAADFWSRAGGRSRYDTPANIAAAIPLAHQAAVVEIPHLDTAAAARLFPSMAGWFCGPARQLRGCLLADVGHAAILVEATDPEDERRFTAAHELAHLLLHYLRPRERALAAFGPSFAAVLDRTRPPSSAELLSSAIRDIPVEPFQHAMDRNAATSRAVTSIEDQADDLAVELLAPWASLQRFRGAGPGLLRETFGLPAPVAARLSALIAPSRTTIGVLGMFGAR
jgi:hypothetical protein